MTQKEMFEKSFERPRTYFKLSGQEQWHIDKSLGILDWLADPMSGEDRKRFYSHYDFSGLIDDKKLQDLMK